MCVVVHRRLALLRSPSYLLLDSFETTDFETFLSPTGVTKKKVVVSMMAILIICDGDYIHANPSLVCANIILWTGRFASWWRVVSCSLFYCSSAVAFTKCKIFYVDR